MRFNLKHITPALLLMLILLLTGCAKEELMGPMNADAQLKSAVIKDDGTLDTRDGDVESFGDDDTTNGGDDDDDDGITDDNDDEDDDGDITDDNDDEDENSKDGPDTTNGMSSSGLNTGNNHPFRY
jgi:hypothetical protein